jgi:hypothetical protein
MKLFLNHEIFDFFRKYMGKIVGAGAEIFDKLEPEPKFLTSWSRSRSRAAQKWTGSATLVLSSLDLKFLSFGLVKSKSTENVVVNKITFSD